MTKYKKPAYIELPMNLAKETLPIIDIPNVPISVCKTIKNKKLLNQIINKINSSQRPVVVIGTRMKHFRRIMNNFIAKTKFATCCLPNAYGIVSVSNPNYIGVYWEKISSPGVQQIIKNSDFIIYLGCLINDYNSSGYTHKNIPSQTLFIGSESVKYNNVSYETSSITYLLNYVSKKIRPNNTNLKLFKKIKKPIETNVIPSSKPLTLYAMRKITAII